MAVTYTQFIAEYPEFAAIEQAMIDPLLTTFDAFYEFGSALQDEAVYTITALTLNDRVYGQPSSDTEAGPNKYQRAWDRMLVRHHRRGHLSGGGLT